MDCDYTFKLYTYEGCQLGFEVFYIPSTSINCEMAIHIIL